MSQELVTLKDDMIICFFYTIAKEPPNLARKALLQEKFVSNLFSGGDCFLCLEMRLLNSSIEKG